MENYDEHQTPAYAPPKSIFLSTSWLRAGLLFRSLGGMALLLFFLSLWIYNSMFSATAHNNHGMSLYHKGHYDEAIAELNQAISIDAKDAKAYSNRGLVHFKKNEYDLAIADCTQAIKLDPNLAAAYDNRGLIYQKTGDTDHAFADFDQAVRLQSDNYTALFNRAITYIDKGDNRAAATDFQKIVQLSTDATLKQKAQQELQALGSN